VVCNGAPEILLLLLLLLLLLPAAYPRLSLRKVVVLHLFN